MSKETTIGIIALVVIIGGGYFLFNQAPAQTTNTEETATSSTPSTSTTTVQELTGTARTFTIAEVATHKDATSCWSIVNSSVYDLTSWIKKHPGGEKGILSICGKDGTAVFEKQHGGKEKQEAQLATFKIGTVSQ